MLNDKLSKTIIYFRLVQASQIHIKKSSSNRVVALVIKLKYLKDFQYYHDSNRIENASLHELSDRLFHKKIILLKDSRVNHYFSVCCNQSATYRID